MGPQDLFTATEVGDGKVVVSVKGEVDLVSSGDLRRVLDDAVDAARLVEVDMAELTFIDSSGLSALVGAHRHAHEAGGVLVVRNPPAILKRLLDITKLDTLLVVDPPESDETPSTDEG